MSPNMKSLNNIFCYLKAHNEALTFLEFDSFNENQTGTVNVHNPELSKIWTSGSLIFGQF